MAVAGAIWIAAGLYLLVGGARSAAFLRSVARSDPAASGAGTGFWLLVWPGCVLLWPVLARGPRRDDGPARVDGLRRVHLAAWAGIGVLVVVLLGAALTLPPAEGLLRPTTAGGRP